MIDQATLQAQIQSLQDIINAMKNEEAKRIPGMDAPPPQEGMPGADAGMPPEGDSEGMDDPKMEGMDPRLIEAIKRHKGKM